MSDTPIHAGTYRFEWNIIVAPSPFDRRSIPGDDSKDNAWVSNARALIGSYGMTHNYHVQTLGTGGLSGYTHRLILTVTLRAQTLFSQLDTAVINAYKQAYDRGISTTQFVRVLNTHSFGLFPFGVFSIYKSAHHTHSGASVESSAAPQYTLTERLLQPTISSSTDRATVGGHPPAIEVTKAIADTLGDLSNAATIPLGYKVAGAAVLTVAGLAVLGYAYRSFK